MLLEVRLEAGPLVAGRQVDRERRDAADGPIQPYQLLRDAALSPY